MPKDFAFGLFELDWDAFGKHIENGCKRIPKVTETGIRSTVSGPGMHYSNKLSIGVCTACQQGIIDMNRNGNLVNFFSYVCNDKKIKELFASTLDRKPISVRLCLL